MTTPFRDEARVLRDDRRTLVQQTVDWMARQIDQHVVRAGCRVPSIRALAKERHISRFTVVEAYQRLVAHGYLEARAGSGFFVADHRASMREASRPPARTMQPATTTDASRIDPQWLIRNMFRDLPAHRMPGSGLPPPAWMDADLLGRAIRSLGRSAGAGLQALATLDYGRPQGHAPLRERLCRKLAGFEVAAEPHQIVTTGGATQAFELIARQFVRAGDVVLVDDPAWFLMFAIFAAHGARVIGVPRLDDGPDLVALERLLVEHRPRIYVIASVLHNPTSTSLSAAKAFQVLKLALEHDLVVVEDDVYGDLHPGPGIDRNATPIRIASLDQLERVIYVGSFSKTLAANLRVGFIACEAALAERLADHKMLATLTTPELGERIVCRILVDGHYRKHVDRLRGRFDGVRERVVRGLERTGLVVDAPPAVGMFVWASAVGVDTNALAARLFDAGYLLAPGSLFSPSQLPSPRLRFNLATSANPGMLDALARGLDTPG